MKAAGWLMKYDLLARMFKALAHPVRLRILDLLCAEGAYVCHLVEATGRPQPYVSRHLQVLRAAGLVTDRKEGLRVYYRACDPRLADVLNLVAAIAGRPGKSEAPLRGKVHPSSCCAVRVPPVASADTIAMERNISA